MFVQGIHTCAFAVIYTSIETSPNAYRGKPYLLELLCRELACFIGLQVAMLQLHGLISGRFFFLLSVSACLEKKKFGGAQTHLELS